MKVRMFEPRVSAGDREAIERVLKSGRLIHGPEEEAFCAEFKSYLGLNGSMHGCASGTAALEHALRGLGISKGDRVITVSHTFRANVEAILAVGAEPVFVDVDESMTMNPRETAVALRDARAVLAVHLYGRQADLLPNLCRRKGIALIEDCAQAHGVAPVGDAAAWSFYPTKNLGGLGDGGAVWFKQPRPYFRPDHGLDEIQAAVLRERLPDLTLATDMRRAIARQYDISLPLYIRTPPHGVYHQYVIRAPKRDGLRSHLAARGIETQIHYPVPVHRQFGYHASLPVTDQLAGEILSLPIHPYLKPQEVRYVCDAVREFYGLTNTQR